MSLFTALFVLALLTVKHMFADFFLQTPGMLRDRAAYVHRGRALHCLVHVAGSALVLVVFGVTWWVVLLLVIAEFAVHYHIDYGKGVWSERAAHSPVDGGYWRAFGADQALHHLTYIAMVAVLV